MAARKIFKAGADTQIRTGDLTLTKGALYQLSYISEFFFNKVLLIDALFKNLSFAKQIDRLKLKPGDVLLSHGETPHYHRRCYVSLLSSAWVQVGP